MRLLNHAAPRALLEWSGAADPDIAALAGLAPRLDALFVLAEGAWTVLGGVFTADGARFSATGCAAGRRGALAACLGELAETLAQQMRPGDLAARGTLTDPPEGADLTAAEVAVALGLGFDPERPLDWAPARRLPDGAPCLVPAALVLRGVGPRPPGAPPLSHGCACGPDPAAALHAATLELIERAALARWRAGTPARPIAGAPDVLLLPGEGVPVIAAPSSHAMGVAARDCPDAALAAARSERAAAEAVRASAPGSARPAVRPILGPILPEPCAPAGGDVVDVLERWAADGAPARSVALSRSDLGVSVAKVVALRYALNDPAALP
ncbi:MAG: YcaO-like family protein [Rubrimonas sp.]